MTDRSIHFNYFPEKNDQPIAGQYAVVAFLPSDLDATVSPIRSKFDPLVGAIGAHVTVVFPFGSEAPLEELSGVLRDAIEGIHAVPINLTTIGDFYPDAPVIYWAVEDNNRLKELYFRLYARLEMPIPRKNYIPHVTLAREISDSRLLQVKDEIITSLPTESFLIEALELITLLPNREWITVRKFSLGDS